MSETKRSNSNNPRQDASVGLTHRQVATLAISYRHDRIARNQRNRASFWLFVGSAHSNKRRRAVKREVAIALAILFVGTNAFAQGLDSFYKLGPDSMEQEGVPHGKLVGPLTLPCKVYPGTAHTYWVYVPAQYDASKPASLMIFNDGQAFKNEKGDVRAQNVMDNLIHRREIPVMIGVFINPGKTPEQPEPTPKDWGDRTTNRPTEYNTPDDKYAKVICDELLPVLTRSTTSPRTPSSTASAGPARAPSRRSPSPGNGPINSAK